MIRVLQVFGGLNRGGSETMLMNVFRNIDRNEVMFDFVKHTPVECPYENEIKALGGKIYVAPVFKGYNFFAYRKWWANFFEFHPEYKIVHGHLFTIASIFFDVAHKYNRITIGHSHTSKMSIMTLKNIMRKFFMIRLSKTSDYRFACSAEAGAFVFGKKKFIVLPNAIDSKKFVYSDESRRRLRKVFNLDGKLVIGNIGRLTLPKNQSFLLDIFNEIHKTNKQSSLVIVGVGEQEEQLKKKAKILGIEDSVVFAGSRDDVPALLSAMDVFVFPSIYEGLGLAAIEAQASGLPTVCSDAISEEVKLTDLVNFVPLQDSAEKWAEVVLRASQKGERMNVQQKIVEAGYDIHQTANWLQNFYKSL